MRKPDDEVPGQAKADRTRLAAYVRGEEPLVEDPADEDLTRLREACADLEPRHRTFLELDMVEGASPAEIQRRLELSPQRFASLKREAFTALRNRIRDRL
jgi:DNA-directed RNA polymerase specialized sigma24 family protein